MARRSRQSILKRQREQKRAEKADLKRRKRDARRRGEVFEDVEDLEPVGMGLGGPAQAEGATDDAEEPANEPVVVPGGQASGEKPALGPEG